MMRKRAEIKKIKGTRSCQITYCKKKNCLLKKCHEVSIFCDIDVALVIFAPTGRVSSFCNHEKIEDLIKRYLDRPPKKRYFRFLQKFLPYKLKQLNHIEGDENKLHFLKNQIRLLELEIQRTTFEREILNNVNNSNVQGIAMTKRSLNFTDQDQFRANGRRTKSQDIHGQANRTWAGALNNYGGHLPCSDCPGTQFLPTNYSSVQSQPVIAYQMTFDTPMQQLGGLIGSSSTGNIVHGGAPIWIQNYQTPQTCSYFWNNLSSQNMVAPTSQFQANPNEVYPYSNVNDLTLASNSNFGINTINDYESHRPQFTNSIATAASSAASVAATFNDNGTGPSQVIPPQEDDPLGLLDDFQWAEGLNFDELPSLLE